MPLTLVLVRHAVAEGPQPARRDAERRLSPQGAAELLRGARGLERLEVRPDRILTSPLARAVETAALLVEVLAPEVQAEICAALAPGHHPQSVLDAVGEGEERTVVLVGHEPDLGELASWLLTGSARAARLPLAEGGAAAVAPRRVEGRPSGTLLWMLTPRQLSALGGSSE